MLPLITRILQLPPVESTPLLDLLQSGSNSTVFPLALVLLPTREYACSVLEQFEGICSKVQIPTLSAASRLRRADRYTREVGGFNGHRVRISGKHQALVHRRS